MISYSVNLSFAPVDSSVVAPNHINRLEEGEQVQLEARANSLLTFNAQRILNYTHRE